jgi:hypothetical protein
VTRPRLSTIRSPHRPDTRYPLAAGLSTALPIPSDSRSARTLRPQGSANATALNFRSKLCPRRLSRVLSALAGTPSPAFGGVCRDGLWLARLRDYAESRGLRISDGFVPCPISLSRSSAVRRSRPRHSPSRITHPRTEHDRERVRVCPGERRVVSCPGHLRDTTAPPPGVLATAGAVRLSADASKRGWCK